MLRPILSESAWDSARKVLLSVGRYATVGLRRSMEGILWRLRTGAPWRDLPTEYGDWNCVYKKFNRWAHAGVLDAILEAVEGKIDYRSAYVDGGYVHAHQHASGAAGGHDEAIGPSRGGNSTKLHAVCDRKGDPVQVDITAGNVSDITHAQSIAEELASLFAEIVCDKGYDSDEFRITILNEGSTPCIPIKGNSKRKNPGFHKSKYKKRHRVENLFARLKHFRAIATRYDKLKIIFEGTVKLGLTAIWLGLTI